VTLHLSEVKGPVMDRLRRSTFLDHLSGQVFVSQFEAFCKLTGRCASQPLGSHAKDQAVSPDGGPEGR
jgi:sulfate permease, SulP family